MHVRLGIFVESQQAPDVAVFRREVSLPDLAKPLGFDGIWGPEHHFTDYVMSSNVLQLLTRLAGKTTRVKLGSMVVILPWQDPLRVAEELAVLDQLSQGRLIFGIGRGLGQIEFNGFRVPMEESRARFQEPMRSSRRSTAG